jgi:kinesin family protein 5
MSHAANVNVICRFRPMNELEKTSGNEQVCMFTSPTSLQFNSTREKNRYRFNFDRIFPPSSTQQDIYSFGVKGIIDSVLDGYNGTVLAYGQTSSGKTYTMQGEMSSENTMGIIPRMISHVFDFIHEQDSTEFMIKVSMIEIYQERIRDLLDISRVNLPIREDTIKGIYVDGCSERYVGCPQDVLAALELGSNNRAQAATNMNEHSSRSHSIFILTINQTNKKEGFSKIGKLYLVDLAGSEKISKTGATGHTLEEAKIINKSLTTLGRVINNLTDGKSQHVPYRESKLTRVLQESLGGNSKTCLIITCSPSIYNESETLSTLRFGERAKKIKNKPKINKEVTVAELQKLVDQLKENLKKANARITQLENFIKQNGLRIPESNYKKEEDEEEKQKEIEEKEKEKDAQVKMEEIKKKIDNNKNMGIGERIDIALGLLKEDDTYDNRLEVMANLQVMKEVVENIPGLKDISPVNVSKNAAGEIVIPGKADANNAIQNNCNKLITKIKGFKEIQNNPELLKVFGVLQNQIKNIKSVSNNGGDENQEQNGDSEERKNNFEDKEMQTEKLDDEEYDKMKFIYEREKRILQLQIDDKTSEIDYLNKEIEKLENENKDLKDKVNFDENDVLQKNILLENNLKDLRKKLEQSQSERLVLDNQCNTYIKSMKDKNELIKKLEKEVQEAKKHANANNNNINQSQLNIVKKITGGGIY